MHKPIDLDDLFTYHAPNAEQRASLEAINIASRALAQTILDNTPPGADQTAAIRKVREARMTANAAVVCGRARTEDELERTVNALTNRLRALGMSLVRFDSATHDATCSVEVVEHLAVEAHLSVGDIHAMLAGRPFTARLQVTTLPDSIERGTVRYLECAEFLPGALRDFADPYI